MTKKVIFEYYDEKEFKNFLYSLPNKEAAKLLVTINKISEYGLLIAQEQQWVKKLENNLFEIRSIYGSDITRALYFHKSGKYYVITHGFKKKKQKTPDFEKDHAKNIRKRVLKRNKNEN
ncbi:type II toxin-antitoxin system RelE/ParE family toxin [Lactobacillus kimbladii]|uniref:type II toxin-antitoxin system RelE/ParE family toxin n=1 Tax=Lactobacillus kimbladii TaxID=1218506 RepID=UPI003AF98D7B